MALRFIICSIEQHIQFQQRLGEKPGTHVWAPLALLLLFCIWPPAKLAFSCCSCFQQVDSPAHPCYCAGIGDLVRHRERMTTSSQHSCGLIPSVQSLGRRSACFMVRKYRSFLFLAGGHIPNRGSSSLSRQTLPQTESEHPHRRVRWLRRTR